MVSIGFLSPKPIAVSLLNIRVFEEFSIEHNDE